MATVTAVKNGALQMLGIIGVSDSATVGDDNDLRMDRAYDQVFEELDDTGLATWATAGPVPDKMVPHVEALMAISASDAYGISSEMYQRISLKANNSKREIRRLSIPDYESLDETVDY